MTEAATIIKEMEAATTADEKKSIRANHPVDEVFNDFLRWALDPFRQYGFSEKPWDLAEIGDADAANAALAGEWTSWLEVMEALDDGDVSEQDVEPWKQSAAWPIYQRCLLKRIDGLKNGTINTFRTSAGLSPFRVARATKGEVLRYPAYVEPVTVGTRRIVVIHKPFAAMAQVKVDALNSDGICRNIGFPKRIRETLAVFDWSHWLGDGTGFTGGIVLDGVVRKTEDSKMFQIVDVLPLSKFRKNNPSEPYEDRRELLEKIKLNIHPGQDHFYPVPAYECADEGQLQKIVESMQSDQERGRLRGVVAKLPNMPYPYKPSPAWVWVSRVEKG